MKTDFKKGNFVLQRSFVEMKHKRWSYIFLLKDSQKFWGIIWKTCIDFPFKFQIHHVSFSRNWDKLWNYSENKFSWPFHVILQHNFPVTSITQHKMLLRKCWKNPSSGTKNVCKLVTYTLKNICIFTSKKLEKKSELYQTISTANKITF